MKPVLLVIMGPTASGKTALAIEAARYFNSEVFSFDSRQFYKEMNIGVARPTTQELSSVKHHFIAEFSVNEPLNAGLYARLARERLAAYFTNHKVAVLVGGSGLYARALLDGLNEFPEISAQTRQMLNRELETNGIDHLLGELKLADPESFERIDKQNPRRIIRALEVFRESGMPYSWYRNQPANPIKYEVIKVYPCFDRERLYQRINARCDQMIENGLLEEVRELLPYRNASACQTVGYSEFFDLVQEDEQDKDARSAAIDLFKQHTRNYAKRQETWLRREEGIYPIPAPCNLEALLSALSVEDRQKLP